MSNDAQLRAAALLGEHHHLRERVAADRAAALDATFPLALFGLIALGSAVVAAIAGDAAVGIFWSLAGPAGGLAIAVHYARAERRVQLRTIGPWRPVLLATAIVVSAGVLGRTEAPAAAFVAVAIGYLGFGLLLESTATVAAAAVTAIVAAAVAVSEPADPTVWLGVGVGAGQLACAAGARRERARP